MTRSSVELVSVNVGKPAFFAVHRGQPVRSGIAKRPVEVETLWLDEENLEGDGQADPSSHGGAEKAVYAYPWEHIVSWSAELGQDLRPAAFGENLTVGGWLESDVCIGDRWAWGDALLEVCQPRWPCYKLAIYRGTPKLPARFRETGRTGWYFRVVRTGTVPVKGPMTVVERHPAGISVLDMHEARLHGTSPERLDLMLDLKPLAQEWRENLMERVRL